MKSNNWVPFCLVATIALLLLSLSLFAYKVNQAEKIESLVKQGHDPIAARCAYQDGDDRMCLTYVAQMGTTKIIPMHE